MICAWPFGIKAGVSFGRELTLQDGTSHPQIACSGTSSSNGMDSRMRNQRGNRSTTSVHHFRTSSSRTSCFPREGEMLWSEEYMSEDVVAEREG